MNLIAKLIFGRKSFTITPCNQHKSWIYTWQLGSYLTILTATTSTTLATSRLLESRVSPQSPLMTRYRYDNY